MINSRANRIRKKSRFYSRFERKERIKVLNVRRERVPKGSSRREKRVEARFSSEEWES